jgi:hypothetical protein
MTTLADFYNNNALGKVQDILIIQCAEKKQEYISASEILKKTNLSRTGLARSIDVMVAKNMIIVEQFGKEKHYKLNLESDATKYLVNLYYTLSSIKNVTRSKREYRTGKRSDVIKKQTNRRRKTINDNNRRVYPELQTKRATKQPTKT